MTMTLAHTLAREQHSPRKIVTEATTSFGVATHVRMIRRSQLEITVDADRLSEVELDRPELAGRYCPVSNTLRRPASRSTLRARLIPE
jgi:organic hydroperoxide reductase OsmC/OhrA